MEAFIAQDFPPYQRFECSRKIRLPESGKTFGTSCTIKMPDGWDTGSNKTPGPTRTPRPTNTPQPTSTPLPIDIGISVDLALNCASTPEVTRIKNNGTQSFTAIRMTTSEALSIDLSVNLNPGDSYAISTLDPTVTGHSTLEFYPEPSEGRYVHVVIGVDTTLFTYRGYCNGDPTQLVWD